MAAESAFHDPVLLEDVLTFLADARRVLDGTLGGGGHTAALLERGASVVAIDRDPAARAAAAGRLATFIERKQLTIVAATFADAAESGLLGADPFDGILLDLGVSSHQFDDPARGFTFREGAVLDMRMGPEDRTEKGDVRGDGRNEKGDVGGVQSLTAAEWLNESEPDEIARVFKEYGDERRARKLAHVIASRREHRALATSDDLVGAIRAALGPRSGAPEFARLFQAVRIAVNDELGELERALPLFRDKLTPGGVFVVISYHSGEDRLVKRALQDWSRACVCPPRQPMCTCGGVALGETLTRKPVVASDEEVSRNSRARSAKLRAWRRADLGLGT